jgi:hypothetical protein
MSNLVSSTSRLKEYILAFIAQNKRRGEAIDSIGLHPHDFQALVKALGVQVFPGGNHRNPYGKSILLEGVHIFISHQVPQGRLERFWKAGRGPK